MLFHHVLHQIPPFSANLTTQDRGLALVHCIRSPTLLLVQSFLKQKLPRTSNWKALTTCSPTENGKLLSHLSHVHVMQQNGQVCKRARLLNQASVVFDFYAA